MIGLCETRPAEWWETGDPGNRLALALCRVCPQRRGDDCLAGLPDPKPTGVIRAAVAYNQRGGICPICERCGYPVHDLPESRWKRSPGCTHCRVPTPQSWVRRYGDRREYWRAQWRKRKKAGEKAA